jgi:hypothetical protein
MSQEKREEKKHGATTPHAPNRRNANVLKYINKEYQFIL